MLASTRSSHRSPEKAASLKDRIAKVLVVGATGASGKRLVEQILDRGLDVTAIVRSRDRLPPTLRDHERLTAIEASLLELEDTELARHITGCEAVASCLGHTLSLKGIFGSPRRLVTDATRKLCDVMRSQRSGMKAKFVLMNTTGNCNRDLDEPISLAQKVQRPATLRT